MFRTILARIYNTEVEGLVKDSAWFGAAKVLEFSAYTLEMVLLSRYLATETLGIYFLITSIPELVQHVLDFRVSELMVRYLTVFCESGNPGRIMALVKLFWLVDVGAALLALLIVIAAGPWAAATIIGDSQFAPLLTLFTFGLPFGSLDSASAAMLRVFGRFDLAFWGSLGTAASGLVLVSTAIFTDHGLEGIVAARVIALIISTIGLAAMSLYQLSQRVPITAKAPISELKGSLREMVGFGLQVNLASTLRILTAKMDVIIVGFLLGPAPVAIYKIVTQIAKGITIISDPPMVALYPRFARLFIEGKIRTIRRMSASLSILMLAAVSVVTLALVFFDEPLIRLYAGALYSPHAGLLPIAALGVAPGIVLFWVQPYLLSVGLAKARTLAIAVGAGLGLASLTLLTQAFGAISAVVGFGLTFSLPYLFQVIAVLRSRMESQPEAVVSTGKARILIIGPTPPPYFGVNVTTQALLNDSHWTQRFEVIHLDTSDRRSTQNIGMFEPINIWLAAVHGLRGLALLLRRPDLVYLPISQGLAGYVRDAQFLFAAHALGVPVIIHLHGSEFQSFYLRQNRAVRAFIRVSLRPVQRAIVLAESLNDAFAGLIDSNRIVSVPNGTPDLPCIKASTRSGPEIHGLFLSNLRQRKGLLIILDALKWLLPRHPDLTFTFAGQWRSTALKAQVEKLLEAAPERERIRFVGVVSGQVKACLYQSSDLFIFPPTEPEGHPMVVIEAMAAGLPVISTPQGAIVDTVQDGITGFLVQPGDSRELAKKIEALIEDPDLRERMGAAARARYLDHYTTERSNARLSAVFERLISEKNS